MCVCMYVYVYVCIYAYVYVCVYVCMCVRMHACMNVCMYVCSHCTQGSDVCITPVQYGWELKEACENQERFNKDASYRPAHERSAPEAAGPVQVGDEQRPLLREAVQRKCFKDKKVRKERKAHKKMVAGRRHPNPPNKKDHPPKSHKQDTQAP